MSQFMTLALPCHQKSKTVLPASEKKKKGRDKRRKKKTGNNISHENRHKIFKIY